MFGVLVESKRKRERRVGEVVVSVMVHAAVLIIAAVATARAFDAPRREPQPPVITFKPVAPVEVARTERRGGGAGGVTRPSEPPSLPPTVDVPVPPVGTLDPPAIDPTTSIGDPFAGYHGSRVAGGSGGAGVGGVDSHGGAGYVDTPAIPHGDNPAPIYPEILRAAHVEATLTAQFVVDTVGRVERKSVVFEGEPNALFAAAVRRALDRARFTPAMLNGKPVRMMMRQDFVFRIVGSARDE